MVAPGFITMAKESKKGEGSFLSFYKHDLDVANIMWLKIPLPTTGHMTSYLQESLGNVIFR